MATILVGWLVGWLVCGNALDRGSRKRRGSVCHLPIINLLSDCSRYSFISRHRDKRMGVKPWKHLHQKKGEWDSISQTATNYKAKDPIKTRLTKTHLYTVRFSYLLFFSLLYRYIIISSCLSRNSSHFFLPPKTPYLAYAIEKKRKFLCPFWIFYFHYSLSTQLFTVYQHNNLLWFFTWF